MKNQEIESGDDSTIMMAGRDQIINGQIYDLDDMRNIALDIYRANSLELAGIASEIAIARVRDFIDEFIRRMEASGRSADAFKDPDVLHGVFTAQTHYARSGDPDQRDMLVDLLLERCDSSERNIVQVTLNEAIETVGKLSEQQIAILACSWTVTRTRFLAITSMTEMVNSYEERLSPILELLPTSEAHFEHLVYAGAAQFSTATWNVGRCVGAGHPGLFSRGFPRSAVPGDLDSLVPELFMPAHRDKTLLQLKALNEEILEMMLPQEHGEHLDKLKALMRDYRLSDGDAMRELSEYSEVLADIIAKWSESLLPQMRLTSVGIAIAWAYMRKNAGMNSPITTWIET